MKTFKLPFISLVLILIPRDIQGHGKLWDPVNRSSMWRKGFNTTKNYNDYEENCGGFHVQHEINGGKCGVCGDDYRDPRPRNNENGGIYNAGTVVATYNAGQTVHVIVDMGSNHLGYFTFQLCPLSYPTELEEEECFAEYPLKYVDGSDRFVLTSMANGFWETDIVLPEGVKCDNCVLRWEYVAAQRWGICEDGHGAGGCGPQETFRTCSDIKIQ